MTDQDNGVAFAGKADGFEVHLGNQGTGRIDGPKMTPGRSLADGGSDAVSTVENGAAFRDVGDVVHENDAALAETLDHRAVVNDLVVNVDRRAE